MRIHHLNCGSLTALGGQAHLPPAERVGIPLVCHCLLLATDAGLVLVDSGIGLEDIAHPETRLGRDYLRFAQPRLDANECAATQIERLGWARTDVRHIILTHLHFDHAGGLPDFPQAQVHVYDVEYRAALQPQSALEARGYRAHLWAHGPRWQHYESADTDWFGLPAISLHGLPATLRLVPLIGHSRGHCGVAVQTSSGWLLHAGDAYFFHGEMDLDRPHCPAAHANIQRAVQILGEERLQNQQRLLALRRAQRDAITLCCAHDPVEWKRADTMQS